MSFLPGSRPGRRDPELLAAARRRREAFAADIGDERARAFAHEEPRGPRRWTGTILIALLLFAGLGAIPLLRGSSGGGLIRAQCERPDLAASASLVRPGGRASWQAAGPDSGDYVVVLDAGATDIAGDGLSTAAGRVLAGPIRLTGCASAQTVFDAPTERGVHQITLFRRAGAAAAYSPVAADTFRVG